MFSCTFMSPTRIAPHVTIRWKSMRRISGYWIPALIFIHIIIMCIYHCVNTDVASSQACIIFIENLHQIRNVLFFRYRFRYSDVTLISFKITITKEKKNIYTHICACVCMCRTYCNKLLQKPR